LYVYLQIYKSKTVGALAYPYDRIRSYILVCDRDSDSDSDRDRDSDRDKDITPGVTNMLVYIIYKKAIPKCFTEIVSRGKSKLLLNYKMNHQKWGLY